MINDWIWLTLLNDSLAQIFNYLFYFFVATILISAINIVTRPTAFEIGQIGVYAEKYCVISFNLLGIIFLSNYIFLHLLFM